MSPVETTADRAPRDELVLAKLETLTAKLERLETRAQSPSKEPQSWWVIAAQLLALPALIVTMYFQLSQSGAQRETADLSRAQTLKTQTEELKRSRENKIT